MARTNQSHRQLRRASEMFALIQAWERSSLSQKEFYTHHGIKPHVFWYWLRRYREEGEPAAKTAGSFVSVEMAEEEPGQAALVEVIYSDGTRLVFKERVSATFLQDILPKV